jgi:hypothetical protein
MLKPFNTNERVYAPSLSMCRASPRHEEVAYTLRRRYTTMRATLTGTTNDHTEGVVARTIEAQTAKLPSDTFLWASLGAIATSLVLQTLGKKAESLFIGQWAPTFLILGLYNKIVKELGSDAHERAYR